MTARGDPWQPSHSLGVAVIGHGYWELNLVRDFADLNSARDRSLSAPSSPRVVLGALVIGVPARYCRSVIRRRDQETRSKRP